MFTEDGMNINERRKYLRRMKKRYVNAGRRERGQLYGNFRPDLPIG